MTGTGKMYVVVNVDLKMSIGKIAAQVAHAVTRVEVTAPPKIVIVLAAKTEQIHNLKAYLDQNKISNHLYIDEGVNEVDPMSATVLAIEKIDEDDPAEYLQGFKLLKNKTVSRKRFL